MSTMVSALDSVGGLHVSRAYPFLVMSRLTKATVTRANTIIASVLGSVAFVVIIFLVAFCARRRARRKERRAALNEEAAHSDYSHEMPYGSQPMRYVEPMPEPDTSPVERRRERLGHLGGVRDIEDTIVKARAADLANMTDGSTTLHSTLHADGTESPGWEPAGDERKLAASPMPNTFAEREWIAPKDRGMTELPGGIARAGRISRDGPLYRGGLPNSAHGTENDIFVTPRSSIGGTRPTELPT